nr:uncharacterized mitochondrial protein AtMg00810-like [Tanacetum cinerariifolium]
MKINVAWIQFLLSVQISNAQLIVAGNQTNGIEKSKENLVACSKDSTLDAKKKAPEVDESEASDNDEKNDQVSRSEVEGLPQQARQTENIIVLILTNAFEEHSFERFSPFKNAFSLPYVPIVTLIDDIGIFGNAYDDEVLEEEVDMNNVDSSYTIPEATKFLKDHPQEQVIGSLETPVHTRKKFKTYEEFGLLFSVHKLRRTNHKWAIGTKWVYRNKKDEREIVIKNKARLVVQGHTHEEGIDYDEVFALVARIEAISQDKYVAEVLKKFDFVNVKTTSTRMESNKPLIKDEEAEDVDVHSYRSIMGSLMYLTTSRPDITFAVCACARFQVNPKTSHLQAMKRIFRYLKGQPKLGLWYPKDSPFDLEAYSNSDYAGASLDRKFIIGGCQFLGKRLILWQCKKQTIVANSTTKAEYVTTANCCGQATTKVKKANDKEQIQALVDKTKVLITEDSIRIYLCFDDVEGTVCLLNEAIFEGLARMGAKTTAWNEFSSTMASAIICLTDNQKFNFLNLQEHVLDLQEANAAQAKEIATLKKKVSKLNKWRKSRSGGLRRLKKIGSGKRVKSPMEKDGLGAQEDASKHGRMIEEIDQNAEITLDDETQGRTNDDEMFGVDDLTREEVVMETTIGVKDSATPTTNVTEDEVTMAQALAALKKAEEQEAARISIAQQDEESNNTWDNMQAMMDADTLLAERLQAREREEFSEVQKARLLVELIEKRKKHFAALRAQEKRNKPPTKTQIKSQISTYLRHMGGYKQYHLKGMSFDEIKELFDKEMTKVNDFIAMDLEAQESSTKRTTEHLESDISKKQKVDENVQPVIDDFEDIKKCIEIVPDDGDEVLIEATPISSRFPTIIDYKIHKKGKKNYFKIIRADGNSQVYQTYEKIFKNFNKDRFKKEKPVDAMDNILFRTLKTMFEHHVEDTI